MSLLDALKRKEENDIPDVSDMIKQGLSQQDIIDRLKQQGYSNTAIRTALVNATVNQNQAKQEQIMNQQVQQTIPQADIQNPPSQQGKLSEEMVDTIQGILEQIIEEKWKGATADIELLKNEVKRTSDSTHMLSEQIDKINQRIDEVQNIILGKTNEYNKALTDVNVELEAFNKIINKLVPAFSDSIKELRDLIEDFKSSQGKQ